MNNNKSKRPLFSVIVPTYNQAEYLTTALDSILYQTIDDWEAIVINDGSKDNTAEVMEKYAAMDSRIKCFHKENGGAATALNRAVKESNGEWICWLSSDDIFEYDKLEVHKNAIEESPDIKFFYSHWYLLNSDTGLKTSPPLWLPNPKVGSEVSQFFLANYCHALSIAAHYTVFEKVGEFDKTLLQAQDFDMWLRISAEYPSKFINYRTVVTRLHDEQTTNTFPEGGLFDSALSCLNLINRKDFQGLFPHIDLADEDNLYYALKDVIRIACNPNAFIYKGGYTTAFIDRATEWLNNKCSEEIKKRVLAKLEHAKEILETFKLPNEIRSALLRLLNNNNEFNYSYQDFRDVLKIYQEKLNSANRAHLSSAIDKYLNRLDDLNVITNSENLVKDNSFMPNIIVPRLNSKGEFNWNEFINQDWNEKRKLKDILVETSEVNLSFVFSKISEKEVQEIIKLISNCDVKITLELTPTEVDFNKLKLLQQHLSKLCVSINTIEQNIFDVNYPLVNYEKFYNNLKEYNSTQSVYNRKLKFLINSENLGETKSIINFAENAGFKEVELEFQILSKTEFDLCLWNTKDEYNKIIESVVEFGTLKNIKVLARKFNEDDEFNIDKYSCDIPDNELHLSENTEQFSCGFSKNEIKNNEKNIYEKWNSSEVNSIRNNKCLEECNSCQLFNNINNLSVHVLNYDREKIKKTEIFSEAEVYLIADRDERWVLKSINSLLEQNYPFWKLTIVTNDKSEYPLSVNLTEKENRISIIEYTKEFTSNNVLELLKTSESEFVSVIKDGDCLTPIALENQIKKMHDLDETYAMVFGDYNEIDTYDYINVVKREKPFVKGFELPSLLNSYFTKESTMLFRTGALKQVSGVELNLKHLFFFEVLIKLYENDIKFDYVNKKIIQARKFDDIEYENQNSKEYIDALRVVNYCLCNYSFSEIYKNIDLNNDANLREFQKQFIIVLQSQNSFLVHPSIMKPYWDWLTSALVKNLKENKNNGVSDFIRNITFQLSETNEFFHSYKSALVNKKFDLRKDELKFNDNLFLETMFRVGEVINANDNVIEALHIFNYLVYHKNIRQKESANYVAEITKAIGGFARFLNTYSIDSIKEFSDELKLFYLYALLITNADEQDCRKTISLIDDNSTKENINKNLQFNKTEINPDLIKDWDYNVLLQSHKSKHTVKIECPSCKKVFTNTSTTELNRRPQNFNLVCYNCFSQFTLQDIQIYDFYMKRNKSVLVKEVQNKNPKISFLVRDAHIMGGGTIVIYKHIEWLSAIGFEITVYSECPEPDWVDLSCKFEQVDSYNSIKNNNEDLIVIFSIKDLHSCIKNFPLNKIAHFCQGYEGYHFGRSFLEMREDKAFFTALHKIPIKNYVISEHIQDLYKNLFNRESFLVPNSVDHNTYKPMTDVNEQPNTLLFIGNPNHVLKGFNFLKDTLSELQKDENRYKDLTVYCVWGRKDEEDGYEDFVENYENFRIIYKRALNKEQLATLMNEVSAVINNSWYEGFSLPVIEAMACGRPVITSNNIGAEGFCIHDVNSFISPYGNTEKLLKILDRIFLNPESLFDIRKNALLTSYKYSEQRQAKNLFEAFSKMLDKDLFNEKTKAVLGFYEDMSDETVDDSTLIKMKEEIFSEKKKILLVPDVKWWIFYKVAKLVEEALMDDYEVRVLTFDEMNRRDWEWADKVMFWDYEYIVRNLKGKLQGFWTFSADEFVEKTILRVCSFLGYEDGFKPKELELINNIDGVVASCDLINDRFKKVGLSSICIHDFVDLDKFKQIDTEKLLENIKDKKWGWAGREQNNIKGLNLMQEVAQNFGNAQLANQTVHPDQMPEFYELLGVYVNMSRSEGTPIPVLEACAKGLPVISTNVGIVPELAEKTNGVFVIEGNTDSLAYALRQVMALSKEELVEISNNNRKAAEEFSAEKIKKDYKNYFDKIFGFNNSEDSSVEEEINISESFNRITALIEEQIYHEAINEINKLTDHFNHEDKYEIENIKLVDLYNIGGTIASMEGNLELAHSFFENELKINPESDRACHSMGGIFYQSGMYEEAFTMYEWAVKYNPADLKAKSAIEEIKNILENEENVEDNMTNELAEKINNAYELFSKKNFNESILLLDEAYNEIISMEVKTDLPIIYNLKGFNFLGLNEIQDAKQNFQKAIEANPQSAQGYAGLGECLFLEGSDLEAFITFSNSLQIDPDNQFALAGIKKVKDIIKIEDIEIVKNLYEAECFIKDEKYSDAKNILLNIKENVEAEVHALNNLAVIEIIEKEYSSAKTYLEQVLTKDNSNEVAIENLRILNEMAEQV